LKILSLGWGVQSWTLAAMVAIGELGPIDFAIHSDTGWEKEKTYEFAKEWTPWLKDKGIVVITVNDKESSGAVIDQWGGVFIPAYTISEKGNGQLRRQCTHRWKIVPMRRWITKMMKAREIKKNEGAIEQWIGITTDEWQRAKDSDVKYIKHQFPLLDKRMSRADCISWLQDHELEIPGKSSCTFCPYHNMAAWQEIKRDGGKDWEEVVKVDLAIRGKRPPYPLFVSDRRRPLPEAINIPEDFGAKQLDMFDAECDSGYCFL